MNIFKDKRFLKYFFVLVTIAVLFPPFYSDVDYIGIQFSFLLDPPYDSDGLSLSILSVEIIACFLLAHIINFVVTKTPKKYLFGIPIFLVLVFLSLMAYDDYATKLQKKEEIKTAIEKAKLRDNFNLAIECNELFEEHHKLVEGFEKEAPSNPTLFDEFELWDKINSTGFSIKGCARRLPYLFMENTMVINTDITALDFNKAKEEYFNNIELKVIEGLSMTKTERAFLGL